MKEALFMGGSVLAAWIVPCNGRMRKNMRRMKSLYFVERAMGKSSLTLATCPFFSLCKGG
jgi:hypothetical protein